MNPNKRCAIYTRKSSNEGLEQDFNSLAAQREACESYVVSQKSEGWRTLKSHYDDGGHSGGTLDRPALQKLLIDIDAHKVDVVVIYKIDRLTRSLTDFARLIEQFDAHEVSVVAVTQPFNTTTSVGRLTLNMLLSFAQFEREITGERIRDKIAASKQKGMWMGGCVPLGYDLGDRELIVNPTEAKIIRVIFERYLALGAVRKLQQELERENIRSKVRVSKNGNRSGGKPFSRGALYALLRNRLYIGEITHQEQNYPGQHAAVIDQVLFDTVQQRLDTQRHDRRHRGAAPSLLAGKLFDAQGHRLSPAHANKNGKRYRYYVSQAVLYGGRSKTRARWPAQQLEDFVRTAVAERVRNPAALLEKPDASTVALNDRGVHLAKTIGREVGDKPLIDLLESATLAETDCTLALDPQALRRALDIPKDLGLEIGWAVKLTVRTCHNGQKRIFQPDQPPEPNPTLVNALVNAHHWYRALVQGQVDSIEQLSRETGRDARYLKRILSMVYIAPDIKRAILEGLQPAEMTLEKLTKTEVLPVDFDEQRSRWGMEG